MRERQAKNLLSIGITVWSEYSNDFIIIECTPSETVQTLLEKCVRMKKCRPPKHGAKLALYTQTEFQKRLPAYKVPLAEFAFNHSSKSITPAEASPTLQACELKDGDGLHVHSTLFR